MEREGRLDSRIIDQEEIDLYKRLKIDRNPDGSLTRSTDHSILYTNPNPIRASFKDITYDPAHNAWLRLYRPSANPDRSGLKLPVLVYLHGGGFMICSVDTPPFHIACAERSEEIPAIVVSVEYRLAPENRLPAAYDDSTRAIQWIRDEWSSEPWLNDLADPNRVFIMGTSAGGNITFHVATRVQGLDLSPVRVAGVILNQPYFGGVERTELDVKNGLGELRMSDKVWEVVLPEGSDRDHEYCNPESGKWQLGGLPRCMVCGFFSDPVLDRQRALAQRLKASGVDVVERFVDGSHGSDYIEPQKGVEMLEATKKFILETK